MVESKLTYEECRRQRLEENKRRMEELNLVKLALSLKTPTPKRSPAKRRVPNSQTASLPVRRSSRFADKPAPNYKEDGRGYFITERRSYRRGGLLNRVYASDEDRISAIERAEKVESSLDSEYPSFVKPMLQSHVTGGFWLGLPVKFCKEHLPHHDATITLMDEEGNDFPTKYLADKTGLSGGWRGFSIDHELVDGDALVFHLVKPTTFKVYIIRVNESEDNEDNDEDKEKDSDDGQLDKSAKRTRAKNMKDNNEDNKDSDDTRLARSAKQSRAKDMKDKNEDNESNSDHNYKGRSIKRTRAKDMKQDEEENKENSDDSHKGRNIKQTRASRK